MPNFSEILRNLLDGPDRSLAVEGHMTLLGDATALELPTLSAEELDVLQPEGGLLMGRPLHSPILSSVGPAAAAAVEMAVVRSLMARGLIRKVTATSVHRADAGNATSTSRTSERPSYEAIKAELSPTLDLLMEVRRAPLGVAVIDTDVRSKWRVPSSYLPGSGVNETPAVNSTVLYGMVVDSAGQPLRAVLEERISADLFHSFTMRGFPEAVSSVVAGLEPNPSIVDDSREMSVPADEGSWSEVRRMVSNAHRVSRIDATFPGASVTCSVRTGVAVGPGMRLMIVGTRRGNSTSLCAQQVSAEALADHVWNVLSGDESVLERLERLAPLPGHL